MVLAAQTTALNHLEPSHNTTDPDTAARNIITAAGYGSQFKHRVGHVIGVNTHENPYLQPSNKERKLTAGMALVAGPGVYLEGMFGVRFEDVVLVREHWGVEVLSGTRSGGLWNP